jgi:hypothetical protein
LVLWFATTGAVRSTVVDRSGQYWNQYVHGLVVVSARHRIGARRTMLVDSALAEYAANGPHPLAVASTTRARQASVPRGRRSDISINVPGNRRLARVVT